MSLTMLLAFCILSCDFLLYVLFRWIYGEKHKNHARRVAARRDKRRALAANQADLPSVLPFPERPLRYRTGSY